MLDSPILPLSSAVSYERGAGWGRMGPGVTEDVEGQGVERPVLEREGEGVGEEVGGWREE